MWNCIICMDKFEWVGRGVKVWICVYALFWHIFFCVRAMKQMRDFEYVWQKLFSPKHIYFLNMTLNVKFPYTYMNILHTYLYIYILKSYMIICLCTKAIVFWNIAFCVLSLGGWLWWCIMCVQGAISTTPSQFGRAVNSHYLYFI